MLFNKSKGSVEKPQVPPCERKSFTMTVWNRVSWRLSLMNSKSHVALWRSVLLHFSLFFHIIHTVMDTHTRKGSPPHFFIGWIKLSSGCAELRKRGNQSEKRVPSENHNIFFPFRGPAGGKSGLCEAWPKIRSPIGYAQERDQCQGAGFLSVTGIPLLQTSRAPLFNLSY